MMFECKIPQINAINTNLSSLLIVNFCITPLICCHFHQVAGNKYLVALFFERLLCGCQLFSLHFSAPFNCHSFSFISSGSKCSASVLLFRHTFAFGLYLAIRNAPTCFLNAFDRALTQSTNFYCRLGVDLWLLFCFLYYLLQPAFVFIYLMLFALSNNFLLF